MADGAVLNAGSGGITLATDDVVGVHYQIIKLAHGALDSVTLVSTSNPLPVVPQTEIAGVGVGAAADAEAAGNGSAIALLKRLRTLIAAGLPTALVSGRLDCNIGNTPNVNIANTPAVTLSAATSGGCSTSHKVSAASTNATNVKAAAGQVYGINIFNNAAYPIYVKLHDTAVAPTAGSGVVRTFGVQAGTQFSHSIPQGMVFTTGIGFTIVKGIADTDATNVAANDCVLDLEYK